MAEKLRIVTEKVDLEVNDNGDIVTLPVSDELFLKRISDFAISMQAEAEKLQNVENKTDIEILDADINFHKILKQEFNSLFGDKSYEKVFGDDVIVGAEYVFEFLEMIMPYIKKHNDNRANKLNKYSANRVGSSL